MKVELRITVTRKAEPISTKRGRPRLVREVMYTPAIIDASRVEFAYIDEDGDISLRYSGTGDYISVKNIGNLIDRIDAAIERRFPEVKGLR